MQQNKHYFWVEGGKEGTTAISPVTIFRHCQNIVWLVNIKHEENYPLQLISRFLAGQIPAKHSYCPDWCCGLCLLRTSEVWRLFIPNLRRWVNSYSGSDFKLKLVYKIWYFLSFLHKLWPAALDKIIAYIVIKICLNSVIKTYFLLLGKRVNLTQMLNQLTDYPPCCALPLMKIKLSIKLRLTPGSLGGFSEPD